VFFARKTLKKVSKWEYGLYFLIRSNSSIHKEKPLSNSSMHGDIGRKSELEYGGKSK